MIIGRHGWDILAVTWVGWCNLPVPSMSRVGHPSHDRLGCHGWNVPAMTWVGRYNLPVPSMFYLWEPQKIGFCELLGTQITLKLILSLV